MKDFDVIVVGGGPAGLLAAGRAAELGGKVLLLEKMRKPGRKLLVTGKGRCNITNGALINEFIARVHPNGRFLRYAFSQFFSKDILNLLKEQGVNTVMERGGRYFPESNKAHDVLQALLRWVSKHNVQISTGSRVQELIIKGKQINGVIANGQKFNAKRVILAMGGNSYPATGSNGDGYKLANQAGHSIESIRPSLVPLETDGDIAKSLQGLTLKNVRAVVWSHNKKLKEDFGEMIFTHFGLSGPIILTLSRFVVDELRKNNPVEISLDLKPALDEQKLDNRLLRDLNQNGKKKISSLFRQWLPSSMIPVFLEQLDIEPTKQCHQITSKERKKIRFLVKNLKFKITGYRSWKEAIITAGGVPTKEICSKSMESKLLPGLHLAGEMIDLDAQTGGYNLQIAYSTGWLAGNSCMEH